MSKGQAVFSKGYETPVLDCYCPATFESISAPRHLTTPSGMLAQRYIKRLQDGATQGLELEIHASVIKP